MKLSCVTASYVGEPLAYPGHIDWGLASRKIEEGPTLATIDGILSRLAPAKLNGLELWTPHASPANLTPVLASAVRQRLAERGMVCCAYAGGVPDPATDAGGAEQVFQAAMLLKAAVIAGHLSPAAVPNLGGLCAQYGIRAAFENGGESLADIQAAIKGGDPQWVGANLDTGSLGLYAFLSREGIKWNLLSAAALVITAPIIIIFFLAQQQFIEGITMTGIKG